jgi:hypothetical protein
LPVPRRQRGPVQQLGLVAGSHAPIFRRHSAQSPRVQYEAGL